jgi:hypothetical protein
MIAARWPALQDVVQELLVVVTQREVTTVTQTVQALTAGHSARYATSFMKLAEKARAFGQSFAYTRGGPRLTTFSRAASPTSSLGAGLH